MQSPRDSNATARKKNRKTHDGSVANIFETYDDNANSLITFADIQSNSHRDVDFMKKYIATRNHRRSVLLRRYCKKNGEEMAFSLFLLH